MQVDITRIVKIMMLAQSPVDAEALAALRKATSLLHKAGLNWEQFLIGQRSYEERTTKTWTHTTRQTATQRSHRERQLAKEALIRMMLEDLLTNRLRLSASTKTFLRSLQAQVDARGWLTPKQFAALEKVFYGNQ